MPESSAGLLHPRLWPTWLGVALITPLCYLPYRLRDALAAAAAALLYRPQSRQIKIARVNLGLCFPHWSEQKKEEFLRRYFIRYIQVLLQAPLIWWSSGESLWRRLEAHGLEHLQREQEAGHPVILLFNHSMAVDFGAVGLSTRYPMCGIYKPFNNPVIDWLFRRGRYRSGARLSVRGSDLRAILKALNKGVMLAYLCDEDFGASASVFAPFFGQSKATLNMLPRLARHSKCKIVPVFTHYDIQSGKFVLTFKPAMVNYPGEDDVANAGQLNRVHEQLVSVCPEQYLWKLRYFRTREDGAESFYRDL